MRFSRISRISALSTAVLFIVALQAQARAVDLLVNPYHEGGTPLNALVPGDEVSFQVGVSVDPTYDPEGMGNVNQGLAALVYNMFGSQAQTAGYFLGDPVTGGSITEAFSGYDYTGAIQSTTKHAMWNEPAPTGVSGYNAGWGFDTGGLPSNGAATEPGIIKGAGLVAAPFGVKGDVRPHWPGNQQNMRLGVGHGTYTAHGDDGVLPDGFVMGFGQDLPNIEGDGTWMLQEGVIDTSGWAPGTYDFVLTGTSVEVLAGDMDFNVDQGTDYSKTVPEEERGAASFSITLIPEPTTLGLVMLAGVALVRRRR